MPPVILTFWSVTRDGRHRPDLPPRVEDHDDMLDDAVEALALAIDEQREGAFLACERILVHADGTVEHEPVDILPDARERVASWRRQSGFVYRPGFVGRAA